ncbi:MAG TPA: hypothetical protein VH497_13010 [Vicinamibacterales bacterium]|jgi:hypothetical protein
MTSTKRLARLVLIAVAAISLPLPISAQNPNIAPSTSSPDTATNTASGWILTPAISASTAWDNNVFVQGEGDEGTGDLVNIINPRLAASYDGRVSAFNVNYSGAFLLYRTLSELNSFDQRLSASARRRLTRHVTWFAENAYAAVPTTELSALVGVPFVRTGSRLEDFRSGVEAAITKRTTLAFVGNFQWIAFDNNPAFVSQLHGGQGIGGEGSLRHQITARTSLLADYGYQFAHISETGETFAVQTTEGGLEHRFSEYITAFAEGGIARLDATVVGQSRIGPSIRAGLSRRETRSSLQVSYSRTFVPSYGFGGTTQNEELLGSVTVPFARRFFANGATAFRRNEPLTIGQPSLRSFWFEGSIGYDVNGVAQIEGFFGGAHQIVDRPGGVVNRNRIGVQVVTSKRMRIH